MEVEHGLAGIWPRVGHDTVTALGQSLLCCDLGTRDHELSQEIGVLIATILDCRHMLFGDDQCVDRGLGIDIIEGHRAIVLMDNLGRDGFLNNSAKRQSVMTRPQVDCRNPDFPYRVPNS